MAGLEFGWNDVRSHTANVGIVANEYVPGGHSRSGTFAHSYALGAHLLTVQNTWRRGCVVKVHPLSDSY